MGRCTTREKRNESLAAASLGAAGGLFLFGLAAEAWSGPRFSQRELEPLSPPELSLVGTYRTGLFDAGGAEISAYDPRSKRLFFVNAGTSSITVLDLSDPAHPALAAEIPTGNPVNSVAVNRFGLVGAAVEGAEKTLPGEAVFFPADFRVGSPVPLTSVTVGALPDMITFTPDGKTALVANEGEPNDAYTVDPEGSVSVIDLRRGLRHLGSRSVKTADFTEFNAGGPRADELPDDVRIFGPGASVAQDLEPEYVTVDGKGRKAYVTLQENNAVAVIDIQKAKVDRIFSLGTKDHFLCGQGMDPSDRDDGVHIGNWPVQGLFLPDAIASFERFGKTFLITANEGDTRDYDGFSEETRVKDLDLDPAGFPGFDVEDLQANENLGRLKVTSTLGDADGDGLHETLYSFGARSFSIWDAHGRLIFDSGDEIERRIALAYPDEFNSDNTENGSFDSRSDDKGPEPEAVAVGRIGNRDYAFIGLERMGGILVYDVSHPRHPKFIQYLNARDFAGDPGADTAGELGPEGLLFVDAKDSPNGKALLIAASEISGSVAIYTFE